MQGEIVVSEIWDRRFYKSGMLREYVVGHKAISKQNENHAGQDEASGTSTENLHPF